MKTDKEILTDIQNTEELLNEMFKEKVSFSFSQDVVFHNCHIVQLIDSLIEDCTEFFLDYKKTLQKSVPKDVMSQFTGGIDMVLLKNMVFLQTSRLMTKNM